MLWQHEIAQGDTRHAARPTFLHGSPTANSCGSRCSGRTHRVKYRSGSSKGIGPHPLKCTEARHVLFREQRAARSLGDVGDESGPTEALITRIAGLGDPVDAVPVFGQIRSQPWIEYIHRTTVTRPVAGV